MAGGKGSTYRLSPAAMILFWILAALISSAAALLVLSRAARAEKAEKSAATADPTLEVYRRQLAEIDDLAERGLLGDEERKSARAEAGRRLLGEAERRPQDRKPLSGTTAQRLVVAAAVAAPVLALVGYMMTGSPGFPDQPFKARLKSWQHLAQTDPSRLSLPEMGAVLESFAAERPKDPQPRYFLARVEAGEGDFVSAARDVQKLTELAPNDPKVWALLGVYLTEANQGQVSDDAVQAFRRANALDPSAIEPRYFLARADIAAGRTQAGLTAWRALLADVPENDARRTTLVAEIDAVAKTGRLPSSETAAPAAGPPQGEQEAAFVQSMVDRLAARLKAQPNDPEGWARLIRAYGVLRQPDRKAAAEAEARRLFKDRPEDLKTALQGEAAPSLGGG
jgi:cytochrome c-type biogenesis protein CcmH